MANKLSNMDFSKITIEETVRLTEENASGRVWSVFAFLKANITVKTGQFKKKIGDDDMNYNSIGKRLGINRSTVKRCIEWLNDHNFIDSHIVIRLHGGIKLTSKKE